MRSHNGRIPVISHEVPAQRSMFPGVQPNMPSTKKCRNMTTKLRLIRVRRRELLREALRLVTPSSLDWRPLPASSDPSGRPGPDIHDQGYPLSISSGARSRVEQLDDTSHELVMVHSLPDFSNA